MNAIGYIRKSTKDQSHYSLEYQESSIKNYCKNNRLQLSSLFVDDGESSYTFDRPDYKALENFIRKHKGKVRYLIVLDHDRFSRNLPEALLKIDQLEKRFGLKVIATNESLDIDTKDPAVFMQRAFKYLIANQELFTIRRRAKLGIRQAQLSGRYVNKAPFGYMNVKQPDGKGIIQVDESKAFIIQKIFRDYLSGIPHYLIYQDVRKIGFPHSGNSSIARILKNPLYAGLVKVSGTEKEPEKLVKGVHKAIITTHQYFRAQEMLDDKRIMKSQPKEEFPLRGILQSPCCGRKMTAGWTKGKLKYYIYYRCIAHSNVNISGKLLHDKLHQLLHLLSFTKQQIEKITSKVKTGLKETLNIRKKQLAIKEEQYKSVDAKLTRAEEKFMDDAINKNTYKKWERKYMTERSRLEEEISYLKSDIDDAVDEELALLPQLLDMETLFSHATINQQHSILNEVFKQGLTFREQAFRTPAINPAFNHKTLIIREKGLLFVEQSLNLSDGLPFSGEGGIRTLGPP